MSTISIEIVPKRCARTFLGGFSSSPPPPSEEEKEEDVEGASFIVRVSFSRIVRNKLSVNSAIASDVLGP